MDNSSRNIVSFIATLTVAVLLLMGAHFYSESRDAEKLAEASPALPKPAPKAVEPTEQLDLAEAEFDAAADAAEDSAVDEYQTEIDNPDGISGAPTLVIQPGNQPQ